ncbi:hypothetical protein D3C80_1719670 [compost metagenome]
MVACRFAFEKDLLLDPWFQRRAVQRPVEGQVEVGRGVVQAQRQLARRPFAQLQGLAFNVAQQTHDPPVLQPGLVVQVAAQLLGQPGYGALRGFPGFQPVVVHAQQAPVRFQALHRGEGEDLLQ